jgi:hypothetical protein
VAKLIKYDVSEVETSGGGTGVKVKPGVRVAKIERCTQREEKRDGTPANDIEVALNFGEEYDWGFTYVGLAPSSDWKLAEFVRALGLKEKGNLDPDKMVGKYIRAKINPGTYEGAYSPDIGRLMKIQPGDIEAWENGNGSASEISSQKGPDVESEEEEETTEEAEAATDSFYREGKPDPEDPNETVGAYDDWPDDDLAAEVTDRDLQLAGGRGGKKAKMIAALRADDEAQGSAESEEEAEAEDDEAEGDEYDDWDLDQLKAEWGERALGDLPAVRGRNADARLKVKLIEELRQDDKANPFEA